MKITLEGSEKDVKWVLTRASYDEGFADARTRELENKLASAEKTNEDTAKQLRYAIDQRERDDQKIINLEKISKKKDEEIASFEKIVKDSCDEIHRLKTEPIKLSDAQEKEIDELWKKTIEEYKLSPLSFYHPGRNVMVSAKEILTQIFGFLANKNKVGAIRAMQEAAGFTVREAGDMLRASYASTFIPMVIKDVSPTIHPLAL